MKKLSVAIITKNEEKWIANCLASVNFADEIVIVDDFSEDKTVLIAKSFGAQVYQHQWLGFSAQRNIAFERTSGNWVLFLDADERASHKLATEIRTHIDNTSYSAFAIPHLNIILGKKMFHGGWWPDYQLRLVRKDKFLGWQGELHEQLVVDGKIGTLKNPLIHLTHRGLYWMMEKTIKYSEIEADLLFKKSKRNVGSWTIVKKMVGEFWRRGIKKTGFADGFEGWLEIFYQTFSIFVTYFRLWERSKSKSWDEIYLEIDKELVEKEFDV